MLLVKLAVAVCLSLMTSKTVVAIVTAVAAVAIVAIVVVVVTIMNGIIKRDSAQSKKCPAHAELSSDSFEVLQPSWRISAESRDISRQISFQQVSQVVQSVLHIDDIRNVAFSKELSSVISPAAAISVASIQVLSAKAF